MFTGKPLNQIEKHTQEGGTRNRGELKRSVSNQPLISIITVVRNGEVHLEEAIKSVLNQSYGNIEYVVIDGNSTDSTLDIIRKYEDRIDYWISEPDKGISDAFNKGIALCKGEWIGIINADDWYELDTFNNIIQQAKASNSSVIYGNMQVWKDE